jgi:hypothetical protein
VRETYARFGRENLGFVWLFGEFLVFALPVIVMWHFHPRLLLFRHGGHMLRVARLNMALFYHRDVTPFNAVEVVGNYGAVVFLSSACTSLAQWRLRIGLNSWSRSATNPYFGILCRFYS